MEPPPPCLKELSQIQLSLECRSQWQAADGVRAFSHSSLANPQASVCKQEDEPLSY